MTKGIGETLVNRTQGLKSLSHFHMDSLRENLEGTSLEKKIADSFPNQGERSLRLVRSGGY